MIVPINHRIHSGKRKPQPFWNSLPDCTELLSITFEEGTWAAWLYDLLKPRVASLVVATNADRAEDPPAVGTRSLN